MVWYVDRFQVSNDGGAQSTRGVAYASIFMVVQALVM